MSASDAAGSATPNCLVLGSRLNARVLSKTRARKVCAIRPPPSSQRKPSSRATSYVIALRVDEDFNEVRVLALVRKRAPVGAEQVGPRFRRAVEAAERGARALGEHGQALAERPTRPELFHLALAPGGRGHRALRVTQQAREGARVRDAGGAQRRLLRRRDRRDEREVFALGRIDEADRVVRAAVALRP
jgi:hypothetical protein